MSTPKIGSVDLTAGGGLRYGLPFVPYSLLDSNGKLYNKTASVWPKGTENVVVLSPAQYFIIGET
ncbi:hypothetical protein CROQUDRAFT_89508 [Cronartium quercuum f. sp. fusiforme G11]|uniref:Uncharacterized protein n=1 Tax=Cronartium quercuum f. sp. fusiforme G11 TaxID=708437 RepID=A0A9P6TE72_9BASI|nr:hypothetical protein CROQUDRAFT_89508 [Cronartium quercuum f. sp. fusiforme G11]